MNQMVSNVFEQAINYLKQEVIPTLKDKVLPKIINGAKELAVDLKGKIVDLFSTLSSDEKADISIETFETLNKERLVEVAKKYVVEGADGIAAYVLEKEDTVFVYLANVKGRDLLPKEDNKYVIIKADCIKNDVRALFDDNKLIILQ